MNPAAVSVVWRRNRPREMVEAERFFISNRCADEDIRKKGMNNQERSPCPVKAKGNKLLADSMQ